MSDKKTTARGFRIYDDEIKDRHGTIRVQESSLAFEGAHTWIFHDVSPEVMESFHLDPKANLPSIQINVANAKKLIAALQTFVNEAEANELTEPVEYEDDSDSMAGD